MQGLTVPIVTASLVTAAMALAGCSATPAPKPSPSAPSTTAPARPTPAPTSDPTLRPLLSADENLAFFDFVAGAVIAAKPDAGGRDFIDALIAGGFDRAAMQVTPDRTAVDLAADSVQWSVLFAGECLIGQYGPASGGYQSEVAAPTGQGACLLGETRPIDW